MRDLRSIKESGRFGIDDGGPCAVAAAFESLFVRTLCAEQAVLAVPLMHTPFEEGTGVWGDGPRVYARLMCAEAEAEILMFRWHSAQLTRFTPTVLMPLSAVCF